MLSKFEGAMLFILLGTLAICNTVTFVRVIQLGDRVEELEKTSLRKGKVIFRVDGIGR